MGKRSNFKRRAADAYDTPPAAVRPLWKHLPEAFTYCEPCAGNLSLLEGMPSGAVLNAAYDIKPRHPFVEPLDALKLEEEDLYDAGYIITNPPWTREILHMMIERFAALRPTWLLFDADWAHTRQSAPYMRYCRKIVPIGRVKWIPGTEHVGKDNACWYFFDRKKPGATIFYPMEQR